MLLLLALTLYTKSIILRAHSRGLAWRRKSRNEGIDFEKYETKRILQIDTPSTPPRVRSVSRLVVHFANTCCALNGSRYVHHDDVVLLLRVVSYHLLLNGELGPAPEPQY